MNVYVLSSERSLGLGPSITVYAVCNNIYSADCNLSYISQNMCQATIIVRCYNEEQHIGRLLSGIMQQTVRDIDVIVVDSGSTDATLSIATQYQVKILSVGQENFSFGRSLNVGCEATSSEFTVIASAHIYPVHKDWLERLIAPFENKNVALVYGKQRGNEDTKYSEQQVFGKWFPDNSNLDQKHPFCNNANTAIRHSLWEKFRYDEELTGLEDIAWAQQVMSAGYKIAYEADAEVVHVHNETPRCIYNRYCREAIALKRIFPSEQFQLWDFARLFPGNVISDCYHAWHEGVLGGNLSSILMFRLMQLWGTYRGFRQHGPITGELKNQFYYPNALVRVKRSGVAKEIRPVVNYSTKRKQGKI